MRLLAGLVWASTAFQTYAASPEASVYFFDKNTEPSEAQPPSLSPSTARLLLAQRLELSQYHSLKDADSSTIRQLNALGGTPKQIFPNEEQGETPMKLLIIVEGWEDPKDILDGITAGPAFTITQPPSPSQNLQLALDLLAQDRHRRSGVDSSGSFDLPKEKYVQGGTSGGDEGSKECSLSSYMSCHIEDDPSGNIEYLANCPSHGRTTILHISSLLGPLEGDRQAYVRTTEYLRRAFMNLRLMPNAPETTIFVMPPHSTKTKRTDYGSYDMPGKPLRARQFQPEEPLSAPEPISTSKAPSHPNHLQPLATSTSHKGPLPVCHISLEEAITATNNCSSHGTVYMKYSPPNPKKERECYACKCNKTVITNDDGTTKTIYWGGPACQKKDVSVPFFLLAGLTIAMLATVSWAIGLLFSIGQEDLPSVIGAGVAGPRAQK